MAKYKSSVIMEFMVGLPGSGKTTFAKEFEQKLRGKAKRIDFDAAFELSDWSTAKEKDRERIIRNVFIDAIRYKCPERLILDGLFLTREDITRVLAATFNMFSHIEVGIHHWNEDRETCLKNDGGRRETSSTNTILHAKFDRVIDGVLVVQELEKRGCTNVEFAWMKPHRVQLKPDWERYFRGKITVQEDGKIYSERWCVGGTCGSCFRDSVLPVSADPQPDFEELEDLLIKIAPSVTFLQYKKIMRECVEITENYESDYYGGGCTYNRYVCDIKKLYEMLNGFGYVLEN